MQERRPPQVTVRDPSRPADLLVSGDDEPRPSPFTQRRLQVAGAVVLVAALVAGAVELRERRAAAAEQRRLDRVLDLAVEPQGASSSYDPASGEVDLELRLQLRNDGPRDVVVEQGTTGGYVLVQDVVEVAAGGEAPLLLQRRLTCSPTTPPPAVTLDVLRLELRTAAGPRALDLRLDPEAVRDEAARACGFLPLEEAVDISVLGAERRPEGELIAVELASRSVREVVLAAVDPGPGLAVRVGVLDQGEALLPVALPQRTESSRGRGLTFQLLLTVTDCTRARTARPQLALEVRDERGGAAQPLVGYDPAFLSALLEDSCSS